ncbi:hypothetical protein LTR84_010345 [Exophiala bonariae]|uniref:Uncharacterized protein n=1 Tax=Exophiala bonariae TaxID=1690606 RepID=A0AAV9MTP3_9EURO|nr:hypothetical protein LTR84_010345 [Exophiala bonariae]
MLSRSHLTRHGLRSSATRAPLQGLKSTVHPQLQQRDFHPSRPNHLLPELLQLSHAAFQEIHSVSGLPWAYSIPLTAALFRASWIPIQCLIARNRKRRQLVSQPLLAWRYVYRKAAVEARGRRPATEADAEKAAQWVTQKLEERKTSLKNDLPYMEPKWEWILPLAFLPVWFLNAETIRRMSSDTRTAMAWIGGRGDTTDSPASVLIPIESGLETESLAWTSDLVSADPYMILPGVFLILSVWNARVALGKAPDPQVQKEMRRTRLGRLQLEIPHIIQLLAVVFPLSLIWQDMPSAVVLYLIGSSATMLVQRAVIKNLMGETKVIKPLNAKLAMGLKKHGEETESKSVFDNRAPI